MVVSLVDEDGVSLKAFTTSCFKNDLKGFRLGGSSDIWEGIQAPETQAKPITTTRSYGANGSPRS